MVKKKVQKKVTKVTVKVVEPELSGLGDAPVVDSVALEAPTEDADTSDRVA